jgi:hypothetical protein
MGGGLVQVIDANGHILFRSARFGADQKIIAPIGVAISIGSVTLRRRCRPRRMGVPWTPRSSD